MTKFLPVLLQVTEMPQASKRHGAAPHQRGKPARPESPRRAQLVRSFATTVTA